MLWWLIACQDDGLTVHNAEPEASITSPMDGAAVLEGEALTLAALIGDDQTPTDELWVQWRSDLDGELVQAIELIDDEVVLELPAGLDEGEHLLELVVVDAEGASASDTVTVIVEENTAPELELVDPEPFDVVQAFEPLPLTASVTDEHSPADELVVLWSSDLDGELVGAAELRDGLARLTLPNGLSPGLHELRVEAIDPLGAKGAATVVVEASEELDEPPVVVITSPTQGGAYDAHSTVTFSAQVSDDLTDADEVHLSWSGLVEQDWMEGELEAYADSTGAVSFTMTLACDDIGGSRDYEAWVEVLATDGAGNTSGDRVDFTTSCLR